MRVLLTGGTGFLGNRLLEALGEHEVLCLSRDASRIPRRHGVTAVTADLGSDGTWTEAIASFRPEWCFHLAWQGLPDYSLERCRANLDASSRLVDAVSRAGVRRVVVAGSCWEYGKASGPVTESMLPLDVGVFAATKQALLTVVDSVARERAFDYRWARIFFVYGAGQRETSLIPHLRASYTAGRAPDIRQPQAVQDFIHVDDVADALLALAVSDAKSGIYNVGSGTPTSVAHVANAAAQYYGRMRPFETVERGNGFWADTAKTYAATGWRASIGIDEGIFRTLAALDQAA